MRKLLIIPLLFLCISLIGQTATINQNVYGSAVKDAINSNFVIVNDSLTQIRGDVGEPNDYDSIVVVGDTILYFYIDGNVFASDTLSGVSSVTSSNTYRVSSGSAYTTIQSAIDAASVGDIVLIYPGTYDESVSLKNGVDLLGHGNVLIDYDADDANQTLIASGDTCTIQGIKIQRSDVLNNSEAVISNLSKLNFIDCRIGDYADYMPMSCDSSELSFLDTDIITLAAASDTISFTGNSKVNISGGTMIGSFIFRNTSQLRASVVSWYIKNTGSNGSGMIMSYNSADIEVFVQVEALSMDATSLLPLPGSNVKTFLLSYDNSINKVSGNEIQRELSCFGNSTLYMSNVTASIGESRIVGNDSATIFINNWRSVMDLDNNVAGLHNVETFTYTGTMTIRNSHIEFTGYSGTYETMGNPIVCSEGSIVRMYSTTVIDHNNDNDLGQNYPGVAFFKSVTELHNCTLRQINHDGLFDTKRVLTMNGTADWRVMLDNVHLENDAPDGVGLFLEFYDPDNDTLILKGLTMDVLGNPIYSGTAETFDDIVNYATDNFGTIYNNQSTDKNIYVEDTIRQSTVAHFVAVTETKEKLYKTVLSNGIYGDNSGRIYSDDSLEVVFNFTRPLNHVGGKYWTALEGKFFLTHFSAANETGEVWDFDMAAANDTAYHTATEKYDFTSAANYTFTAGEVTDGSYTMYITSTADFKAYAYYFDLMNIKSIVWTIIAED